MHSNTDCEESGRMNLEWFGFFHGSSNSCGVLIAFYVNQDMAVKKVVW